MMMNAPKLHLKTEGHGENLVCLHGFLESSSMWEYLPLEQLPFKKIYIDLPGHGKSPVLENLPPLIQSMAESVDKTLEAHGIHNYSVIGHSMGGYVALQLLKMKSPIRKLILLNSNCYNDSDLKKNDRIRVADAVFHAKNTFLNTALPNLFRDPVKNKKELDILLNEASTITPEAIAYSSLAMSERPNLCEFVGDNISRVYVVQGVDDKIVPMEDSDRIFEKYKDHYFKVSNAGHMTHIENPAALMEILNKILNNKKTETY